MAISQVGFGLKPINKLGSNYNAAQVSEYVCKKQPDYGVTFQAPIRIGRSGLRRIRRAVYSNTSVDGSFIGIQYDDVNGKPIFTDHYTTSDLSHFSGGGYDGTLTYTQFVTDDPYQLYLMKTNADITLSLINAGYSFNDASSTSSDGRRSTVKLDMSTRDDFSSTKQFQFISLGNSVDDVQFSDIGTGSSGRNARLDAGSNVVVRSNLHKYLKNSSAYGI